eukprot:TRINITY_DN24297_c0_g1_i1.p1 TRINITY_DN24297_c0_g1~~TRINITY_DN24297_c0_g1_i1.p1  ORF type:complete len:293 (-),score=64.92 TRINITY_DN24297_c0_g1_i1:52-852(-)
MTDRDDEVDANGYCSPISLVMGVLCFPLTLCGSFYSVREKHEVVLLVCGKYAGIEKEPGLHFYNCWGRDLRPVSKQIQSLHLPITKIVDKAGNPLNVSGIVVFWNSNTKKAAIDVTDPKEFTCNAAQAVLKAVVSRHPYETDDPHSLCLKSNANEIGKEMVELLQKEVNVAGVRIVSFQFNELSYAPEIASSMLKRQQAMALVGARQKIVEGAIDIALGAVVGLSKEGVDLDASEKAKIVTNLLTVICSDTDAKPTVSVGSEKVGF